MGSLSENLLLSLSEDKQIRQNAEISLDTAQKNRNFPAYLLNLVDYDENHIVKLAAAIAYKNVVKDKEMVCVFLFYVT